MALDFRQNFDLLIDFDSDFKPQLLAKKFTFTVKFHCYAWLFLTHFPFTFLLLMQMIQFGICDMFNG